MGNGEWGMGNGEWGMGNGEWGMGNGEGIILVDRFSGINVDPVSPHRKVKLKRMKPCDATRQYEPNINTDYADFRLRPYHVENTGSRPITEVKQRRARLVLGWVTAWEYRVL